MREYTVSQDKNGYWYVHRVGKAYIPVFGKWTKDKRQAVKLAADEMGLTLSEYYEYKRRAKK